MLFNSPAFLFAFLPLFLVLYFVAPKSWRNFVLFAASIFFYFVTSGELTLVLLCSVIVNYGLALQIHRSTGRKRDLCFWLGVALNVVPLFYYKYTIFGWGVLNDLESFLGLPRTALSFQPILPIGISFFTFQALSYIADIYLCRVPPARSLIDFGMYHSCFPQLIAGPIVRYEEVAPQVLRRSPDVPEICNGVAQFCFGLGKKIILADGVAGIADKAFSMPAEALGFASAWLGIIAYTLQIYFDFSGYSDMAIGLGRIVGFPYPENFDQPYRSLSVTEFWRRWHMTLSRWFRDYVYIPLGGNRGSMVQTLGNLWVVFFLCGLWHGAAYTFIAWGLYHGALLVLERLGRHYARWEFPAALRWIYTIIAIMVGWVFFRADTLEAALRYLSAMLDIKRMALSDLLLPALSFDRLSFLILSIILAVTPYRFFVSFVRGQYRFGPMISAGSLIVALIAIIIMSAGSFSPFIYFRF